MQHKETPVPPEARNPMISTAWELASVSLSFFTVVFHVDIRSSICDARSTGM
jgi:hypothetical protein